MSALSPALWSTHAGYRITCWAAVSTTDSRGNRTQLLACLQSPSAAGEVDGGAVLAEAQVRTSKRMHLHLPAAAWDASAAHWLGHALCCVCCRLPSLPLLSWRRPRPCQVAAAPHCQQQAAAGRTVLLMLLVQPPPRQAWRVRLRLLRRWQESTALAMLVARWQRPCRLPSSSSSRPAALPQRHHQALVPSDAPTARLLTRRQASVLQLQVHVQPPRARQAL